MPTCKAGSKTPMDAAMTASGEALEMAATPAQGDVDAGTVIQDTDGNTWAVLPEGGAVDAGAVLVDVEGNTWSVVVDEQHCDEHKDGTTAAAVAKTATTVAAALTSLDSPYGEEDTLAPLGAGTVDAAAKLAEEYFMPTITAGLGAGNASRSPSATTLIPPAKRRRESAESNKALCFSPAFLEKVPSSIQTCRSLLQFIQKRLNEPVSEKPAADGPSDLQAKLEAHADSAGRLNCLKERNGWDTRAKRIIDVAALAVSEAGAAELAKVSSNLVEDRAQLERDLKERGEQDANRLAKERIAWTKVHLRREWFSWCAALLQAREASLLVGGNSGNIGVAAVALDAMDVFKALLHGQGPRTVLRIS